MRWVFLRISGPGILVCKPSLAVTACAATASSGGLPHALKFTGCPRLLFGGAGISSPPPEYLVAFLLSWAVLIHYCMALPRSILFIVMLVTQALPVGLMAVEGPREKCPMSCCAALAETGVDKCGCAATPGVPTAPPPATLPPSQGRELMPTVWIELPDFLEIYSSVPANIERAARPEFAPLTVTMPHVRLTVLFCSFLT